MKKDTENTGAKSCARRNCGRIGMSEQTRKWGEQFSAWKEALLKENQELGYVLQKENLIFPRTCAM
jgi:hypothetical protein